MTYDFLTQFNSQAFYTPAQALTWYGMPRTIEGITIHWWDKPENRPTFDGTVRYLGRSGGNTSAHYVAEAGRVACLIAPENAAWHAGSARGNAKTIGIECSPYATDADYATVAELIRDLRAAYGDLPLYRHSDWYATACPGTWDLARLDTLARSGNVTPPVTPQVTPPPITPATEPIQWLVEPGETLSQVAAYYSGPSVAAIAAANGIQDPDRIQVGQVLTIPGPLEWIVDPGDTLTAIAAYYKVNPGYLARLNGIQDPDRLEVGDVLRIQ